jgi:hypothetical protein
MATINENNYNHEEEAPQQLTYNQFLAEEAMLDFTEFNTALDAFLLDAPDRSEPSDDGYDVIEYPLNRNQIFPIYFSHTYSNLLGYRFNFTYTLPKFILLLLTPFMFIYYTILDRRCNNFVRLLTLSHLITFFIYYLFNLNFIFIFIVLTLLFANFGINRFVYSHYEEWREIQNSKYLTTLFIFLFIFTIFRLPIHIIILLYFYFYDFLVNENSIYWTYIQPIFNLEINQPPESYPFVRFVAQMDDDYPPISIKENNKRNNKSKSDIIRNNWDEKTRLLHKLPEHLKKQADTIHANIVRERRAVKARKCNDEAIKRKINTRFYAQIDDGGDTDLVEDQYLSEFEVPEPEELYNPHDYINNDHFFNSPSSRIPQRNHGFYFPHTTVNEDPSEVLLTTTELFSQYSRTPFFKHFSVILPNLIIIFKNIDADTTSVVLAAYNIVNFYAPPEASLAVGLILSSILSLRYMFSKNTIKNKRRQNFIAQIDNIPELQEVKDKYNFDLSPVKGFISLIFVVFSLIFLSKIPRKDDFDSVFNRCGKFSNNITGVSKLFSLYKDVLGEISQWYTYNILKKISPERELIDKFDLFCKNVITASERINIERLRTHIEQLSLVDHLYKESHLYVGIFTDIGRRTKQIHYHNTIKAIYKDSLSSPARGSNTRVQPVVVQLYGDSGVGKTTLTSPISIDILKHINPDFAKNHNHHTYYRKHGNKYWTNYNSHQHYVTIMDDVNQINNNFIEGVPFAGEIIHLTNTAQCNLEVAEVENKQFAQFNSRLIIITDNMPNPSLNDVIADKEAYYRRIDAQAKVTIKPECGIKYTTADGRDYYKLKPKPRTDDPIENLQLDSYNFTLMRPGTVEVIQENLSYKDLIDFITSKMDQHGSFHVDYNKDLKAYASMPEAQMDLSEFLYLQHAPPAIAGFYTLSMLCKSMSFMTLILMFIVYSIWTVVSLSISYCLGPIAAVGIFRYFFWRNKWLMEAKHYTAVFLSLMWNRTSSFSLRMYTIYKKYENSYAVRMALITALALAAYVMYTNHRKNKKKHKDTGYYLFDSDEDFNKSLNKIINGKATLAFKRTFINKCSYTNVNNPNNLSNHVADEISIIADLATDMPDTPSKPQIDELFSEYFDEDMTPESYDTNKTAKPRNTKLNKTKFVAQSFEETNDIKYEVKSAMNTDYHLFRYLEKFEPQMLSDVNAQEIIDNSILKNLYRIERHTIYGNEVDTAHVNFLFIKGNIGITCAHMFYLLNSNVSFKLIQGNKEFLIPSSDITTKRVKLDGHDRDLIYVTIDKKRIHNHTDITKHFVKQEDLKVSYEDEGVLMAYNKADILRMHLLRLIARKRYTTSDLFPTTDGRSPPNQRIPGEKVTMLSLYDGIAYPATTAKGDCGGPIVVVNKGMPRKILGIHAAGKANSGIGMIVTQEEVLFAVSSFEPQYALSTAPLDKQLFALDGMKISEYNYDNLPELDPGNFTKYARMENRIFTPTTSNIFPSPIHNQITMTKNAPALLKNTEEINIYYNNLRKYFDDTAYITPTEVKYIKHVIKRRYNGCEYRKLTLEEAICGNTILSPIDRRTSPGIPWNFFQKGHGKSTWLGVNEDWVINHPDLTRMMEEFHSLLDENEIQPMIFLDQTKDEKRPIEKVKQGKTRMITVGPMQLPILFRTYFGCFDEHIKTHKIHNGSMLGIDPLGQDWTLLHDLATRMSRGKNCIAGDYTNFDGSLNRTVIWAIFEALTEMFGTDVKSKDYKAMVALWTVITDSLHLHKGILYQLNHSQPSGNPWTTVINILYNTSILELCICKIINEKEGSPPINLPNHLYISVYGDDNFMVFSDALKAMIDPEDITKMMTSLGHVYTTETKTDKQTYRSIDEISILKRKFRYDNNLCYCFAPLDIDVIMDIMNWDREEHYPTKVMQLKQNADTVQRELLQHDEPTYEYWWNKVLLAMKPYDYQPAISLPYCMYHFHIISGGTHTTI